METNTDGAADVSFGYQPPTLTMHGTVAEVTGANAVGMVTDRSFPAGTPIGNLSFS
jgi:hypothetical protein